MHKELHFGLKETNINRAISEQKK